MMYDYDVSLFRLDPTWLRFSQNGYGSLGSDPHPNPTDPYGSLGSESTRDKDKGSNRNKYMVQGQGQRQWNQEQVPS